MSEPSLLAAYVPIAPGPFGRFLKRASPAFAEAAARIVIDNGEDWLILRHLKTQSAVFLAFIFRWGDAAEEIMARPFFQVFLEITDFMPDDASGRLLISAGAMNFLSDDIDAAFTLTRSEGARRDEPLDPGEKQRFDGLLNTHMFGAKLYEQPYGEAMRASTVLDARIRRKVETLLLERQRRVAIERVPDATPLKPVRLFQGYHFNGRFMLHYLHGRITPLPGFDPVTTVQTPWGRRMHRHVAIGPHVIATDPSRLRVIPVKNIDDQYLARDDRHAYAVGGAVVAGADAKTFAYAGGGYARDRSRWYRLDGSLIEGVGAEGRVDDRLYFHRDSLLIGEAAVYLGGVHLPVDPGSLQIRRLERMHRRGRQLCLGWLSDKDGDLVFRDLVGLFDGPQWTRTNEPEARIEAWIAEDDEALLPPLQRALAAFEAICPSRDPDLAELRAIAEFGKSWVREHAGAFAAERPFEPRFWRLVARYFHACRELGQSEEIRALYPKLERDAWADPRLFHHAAWAYAASGDAVNALAAVRMALACGYEQIDDLFVDQDLEPLFGSEAFQQLKEFREANKAVRGPIYRWRCCNRSHTGPGNGATPDWTIGSRDVSSFPMKRRSPAFPTTRAARPIVAF